jgi:hypothetical protein
MVSDASVAGFTDLVAGIMALEIFFLLDIEYGWYRAIGASPAPRQRV